MTEEPKGMYSVRSCPWLLLFVFYLNYVSREMLDIFWNRHFKTGMPHLAELACIQIISVLLPCVIFILLKNVKTSEVIKHRKLSVTAVLMCVLAGVGAQPVSALINAPVVAFLTKHGFEFSQTVSRNDNFAAALLVTALMPAVFEEILMRGIVLHATEKYGYRASLFISAIWFAILHNNPASFVSTLFIGFVLCYAVWMTQSVYAGMIIHFSFNACALLLEYSSFEFNTLAAAAVMVISAVVFVMSISALNRKLVRRYKSYGLGRQIAKAIFNAPMVIIILGYVMFFFTSNI